MVCIEHSPSKIIPYEIYEKINVMYALIRC